MTDTPGGSISVIIPTLNEAEHLRDTLQTLSESVQASHLDIIICDGGSRDKTLDIAQDFPCQIISSRPGRAEQMNQASQQAKTEWLLFLHADSRLPANWRSAIIDAQQWGFFPVQLSGKQRFLRIVEKAISIRSRLSAIATGDQALFFRRDFFKQLGGFEPIPIMEDIAISTRARQFYRPSIASLPVITSSRRWEEQGITKTILLMWWLRLAYWLGTSPQRLHRLYYPDHCR